MSITITEPIVLALDKPNLSEADALISKLRPYIGMIKIGSPLYYAHGKDALKLSANYNIPLFLDARISDIPSVTKNTVDVLCGQLAQFSQESYISIQCSAGFESCRAAILASEGSNTKIVGNTISSTFSSSDMYDVFNSGQLTQRTSAFIKLALKQGVKHFVNAPQHLEILRRDYKDSIVIFSAGIRNTNAEPDDQKRVKTASFAIKNGSDWVIIGRPITEAPDPVNAIMYIKQQIDKVK